MPAKAPFLKSLLNAEGTTIEPRTTFSSANVLTVRNNIHPSANPTSDQERPNLALRQFHRVIDLERHIFAAVFVDLAKWLLSNHRPKKASRYRFIRVRITPLL